MTTEVFPTLAGLEWNIKWKPTFKNKVFTSFSGRETRASYRPFPIWDVTLSYSVLRDDLVNAELESLMGLFLRMGGNFDNFLFDHPNDNAVTNYQFGVGDGVTTVFQLARSFKGINEYVTSPKAASHIIYIDGFELVEGVDYTLNLSTGLVTILPGGWDTPMAGEILTWTGGYYYQARFLHEEAEFNEFMEDLWEAKKVELRMSVWGAVGPV